MPTHAILGHFLELKVAGNLINYSLQMVRHSVGFQFELGTALKLLSMKSWPDL